MNTSLKWIKALVPGLDCGVHGVCRCHDTFGSKLRDMSSSMQILTRSSSDRLQRLKNTRMPTNLSSAR